MSQEEINQLAKLLGKLWLASHDANNLRATMEISDAQSAIGGVIHNVFGMNAHYQYNHSYYESE